MNELPFDKAKKGRCLMETPQQFFERLGTMANKSQYEVCAIEYYRDMDNDDSKAQEAIDIYEREHDYPAWYSDDSHEGFQQW